VTLTETSSDKAAYGFNRISVTLTETSSDKAAYGFNRFLAGTGSVLPARRRRRRHAGCRAESGDVALCDLAGRAM
jgi:hypothetical protein